MRSEVPTAVLLKIHIGCRTILNEHDAFFFSLRKLKKEIFNLFHYDKNAYTILVCKPEEKKTTQETSA